MSSVEIKRHLNKTRVVAHRPNISRTAPDSRLMLRVQPGPSRDFSQATPQLRMIHHNAEPVNTPSTRAQALPYPGAAPIPSPRKTAANERMVIGFASVRTRVER